MDNNELYIQNVKNYKDVFNSDKGKNVLWDLVKASGFLSDGFDKDSNVMAFNAGARSMVLRLLRILEIDEAQLSIMVKEQRKAEQNERKHFNV